MGDPLMNAHSFWSILALIALIMSIYSGHKMVGTGKKN